MADPTRADSSPQDWDQVAGWWQENFSQGADPEYEEQILPLVVELVGTARRIVEVGTGEGQVARALAGAGTPRRTVLGVDVTRNQLVAAVERGGGPAYVQSSAERLPVADSSV